MPVELIAKIQQKNDGDFKLLDVADLDAGTLDVVMQLIAGGGVVAGAHASAPVGEIAVQRKTTTGAPTHVATGATLCWNEVDEILYASQGAGAWAPVGGGSHPNLAVHDALGLATDSELADGVLTAESYADTAAAAAITTAESYTDDGHVLLSSQRGATDGVAELDATGKVPSSELPAFSFGEVFTVASQAEMLALTAFQGDIAVRTDTSQTFILSALPASTLANWVELLNPGGDVTSVNTRTGAVTGLEEASNKGALSGYAALDGSGYVPDAQINPAVARDTEVASAITTAEAYADSADAAHAAAADPHPTYETAAEAQALVDTHVNDTADAHDASAVSLLDAANQYTATDVEAALAEVLDTEQAHEAAHPSIDLTRAPYNCVGNDVANDTAAVQQAMADYPTGSFFVPKGKIIRITDYLKYTSSQSFYGQGGGGQTTGVGSTFHFVGASTGFQPLTKGSADTVNVRFEGLYLTGNCSITLDMERVSYSVLDQCSIETTATNGVALLIDGNNDGGGGQAYFNSIMHTKTLATASGGIATHFAHGANSNFVFGGWPKGTIGMKFSGTSVGNVALGTYFDLSTTAIYLDAARNKFFGLNIEGCTNGIEFTSNGIGNDFVGLNIEHTVTNKFVDNSGSYRGHELWDDEYNGDSYRTFAQMREMMDRIHPTALSRNIDYVPQDATATIEERYFTATVTSGTVRVTFYVPNSTTRAVMVDAKNSRLHVGSVTDTLDGDSFLALANATAAPTVVPTSGLTISSRNGILSLSGGIAIGDAYAEGVPASTPTGIAPIHDLAGRVLGYTQLFATVQATPLNVTGLVDWYDAGFGITLSGTEVTGWAPRVGTGKLTNYTGSPQFTATSANLSSRPAVVFDGNDALNCAPSTALTALFDNGNDMTIVMVADVQVLSSIQDYVGLTASANQYLILRTTSAKWASERKAAGLGQVEVLGAAASATTGAHLVIMSQDGSLTSIFRDASTLFEDSAQDTTGATMGTTTRLFVGGATFTGKYSNAHISQVLIYDHKLDATERGILEAWARDTYGVSAIAAASSPGSTFVFPSATVPAQTVEGSAVWDSNDDVLTIGDGASRKTFGKLGATSAGAVGTAAAGTSIEGSRVDHVHPTGAGTPSTQAFSDAPAVGTGPAAAMTDHKHGMPASSSGGVASFAKSGDTALTGVVTISGGSGIALTESGQDVSIAATGSAAANFLSIEKWGVS